MCGIVGIYLKNKKYHKDLGKFLSGMMNNMATRGPDSAGFAIYSSENKNKFKYSICFKDINSSELKKNLLKKIKDAKIKIISDHIVIETSLNPSKVLNIINEFENLSLVGYGNAIEIFKQVGNPKDIVKKFKLDSFSGTHGIGHTRMATESGVDIRSAHPYWAYPFSDVSVVHNGQLTNYWNNRRALENKGMRFMSQCDSELIAVYLAEKMRNGVSLEDGMRDSLSELDGVFTYLVATKDSLGMAKDTMAAKPMVLYESDDLVAMGSEEIAIRTLLPQEIDTHDPYDGEVKVWQI